jgi:hypothetical protein
VRIIKGTDELIYVGLPDTRTLLSFDVEALGDRVLGHAIRRLHKINDSDGTAAADDPIAAYEQLP